MEGSRAQSFDINNEKLRKIQKGALQPSGAVQVDYFGHSCIRIVSPLGLSILIDPWRNDPDWGWWFPEDFPEVEVDIAISTHAHFDHDALHIPKALITMERMVGTYALGHLPGAGPERRILPGTGGQALPRLRLHSHAPRPEPVVCVAGEPVLKTSPGAGGRPLRPSCLKTSCTVGQREGKSGLF